MSEFTNISEPRRPLLQRIFLWLILLVLLLATAGFLYENVSEARDRRFNPMEGKIVDVNGLKMHIDCLGAAAPTAILESGLGDTYLSWRKVQPEIAKVARVCSYDRAGLGYSDSISTPRTSEAIAQQLHALLQVAQIAPPYVLVGHSLGGFDVRLFAKLYPKEVVAMVLVDSSHPDQQKRFPPEMKNMEGTWEREAEFLAYSMPLGIPRLLGLCDTDAEERAADCNFHTALEGVAEMKSLSQSAQQAASSGPFGDLPLAVLSHDPDKPSAELPADLAKPINEEWAKMQDELSHLSTNSTHVVAKNSAHYIQIDRPDLVTDAIRNILGQVRQSQAAVLSQPH